MGQHGLARVAWDAEIGTPQLACEEVLDKPAHPRGLCLGVLHLAASVDGERAHVSPAAGEKGAGRVDHDQEVRADGYFRAVGLPALKPLDAEVVVDAAVGDRQPRGRVVR